MVPEKRKVKVAGAAVAAGLALTGCAPAGYDQAADYGRAAAPQASAAPRDTASVAPSAVPSVVPAAAGLPAGARVTRKLTGTEVAKMGQVIEDEKGFVLYRFDGDDNHPAKSTCDAKCTRVWRPALTGDGEPTLKNVDRRVVGTVTRADGTRQLTVHGWPLYHYLGDRKAGTWKGQNVNGKWFVIKPDGAKNLTCVPAVSAPIAPPADDSAGRDYSY